MNFPSNDSVELDAVHPGMVLRPIAVENVETEMNFHTIIFDF